MLRIELVKSLIGQKPVTKNNVKALGLGKINSFVLQKDTPQVRGQLHRIQHMVTVTEVADEAPKKAAKKAVKKES